ncbi:unnamed protein product [Camellia sinensis]
MDSRAMLEKPHAVCIPFPVQGHINPMLKLAKLLHNRGFHITFVNTEFNHKRLLKSRGPDSLDGLPSFRFEAIPDGLPESDADATQEIPSLLEATSKHCLAPFKDLIYKLNNTATSNVPPVTCIVSDAIMCFTLAVAEELGIPHVFFWSAGACGFMGMLQYRNLIEKGFLPVKGVAGCCLALVWTVLDWFWTVKLQVVELLSNGTVAWRLQGCRASAQMAQSELSCRLQGAYMGSTMWGSYFAYLWHGELYCISASRTVLHIWTVMLICGMLLAAMLIEDILLKCYDTVEILHYSYVMESIVDNITKPSSITNEYLNTVIDWIPSMQGIRLKDIPSIIHSVNLSDFMIKFALEINERTLKSFAIIFNTFEELEHEVLYALSSTFPPVYTIGPLQLLLNQVKDDSLKSIGSNLWKEVPGCLEWLNSKEPNSVVYVNYGSITVMTSNQLIEFAWGLANSNQTFLWIVRPDLVAGDLAIIPPEFVIETKERGLLASWCPQEQVLAHPSIGGFLTHCGWNSTIESISSGVPMICWPYFGDQQTNCWYSCTQWGIGVEMDTDVKRDVVERLVRELMYGHKGKEMKKRVMEWRKIAEEATMSSSASSFLNLEKMIMQVLLPPRR